MIDKILIELQKGCNAIAAVILTEDCNELEDSLIVDANIEYSKLVNLSKNEISNGNYKYFILKNIDEVEESQQEKFVSMVKDKMVLDSKLPEDLIIAFSIKEKNNIKKISKELYKFCTVVFE